MIRIIILDVSGMYSQIYDELYCREDELSEMIKKYQGYVCIKMNVDSSVIIFS